MVHLEVRVLATAVLAVALLAGCSGSNGDEGAGSGSSTASRVDPVVGIWTRLPAQAGPQRRVLAGTSPAPTNVTLRITADGSFYYVLRGVKGMWGRRAFSTSGTWKPSGSRYTWEFSHPHAEYFGAWVFPDRGTKGTWYLSAKDTLEQRPDAPATVSESYIRSPGS